MSNIDLSQAIANLRYRKPALSTSSQGTFGQSAGIILHGDNFHIPSYTKSTPGQTINVSTAAELAAAFVQLSESPSLLGSVVIQLAAGNYAGAYSIPALIGNGYSLIIKGSTTTDLSFVGTGGTAGNVNTQATVIKNLAGWGINAYRGKWLLFTSGANSGKKRIINSNTADTLTLCGALLPAAPANGDTFEIYSNAASLTGDGIINTSSFEVIFQNINIKGLVVNTALLIRFIEVFQSLDGYDNNKRSMSTIWHKDSVFQNTADVSGLWMFGGVCTSDHCLYYEDVPGATFTWGVLLQGGAHILSRNGDVWDGFAYAALWGNIGGTGQIDLTDSYGVEAQTFCFVKNNLTGILMTSSATFLGISNSVFSGNTTNYTPVAATNPSWCG